MQQTGRPRAVSTRLNLWATAGTAVILGASAAVLATGLSVGGVANAAVHPAAMAILLTIVVIPLIGWAVGGDSVLFRIVCGGFLAKALGTWARITFNESGADAAAYSVDGKRVAELLATEFIWPGDPRVPGGGTGTQNLTYTVGWLYNLTGVRILTAYVVFSFVSFVGMLFFYRAATTAIPHLDRTRYALLLFYLPSMLFWPSSVGKDAWMVGCLGLAALGASGLFRHRYTIGNVFALVAGVGLTSWIRPHMAALITLALAAALAWPSRTSGSRVRQAALAVVALLVLTVFLGQVADFFGTERFEVAGVLDQTASRTAGGGSEFTPVRVSGPFSFALATVTVLFRPLLFETSSMIQLLNSIETMAVVAVAIASARRLRTLPRAFVEEAYVRMVVVYTLGFVMAFSVISNFGILARQRAQLWPFLFVLLALPHIPIKTRPLRVQKSESSKLPAASRTADSK